ncbi:unnamed protein product [Cuscuta europaea]|uniref:DUF641 domain-containing protein n=1 Tax=Cuscuta europaea TaxID=41803 RepID=A0A9P0YHJ4_CUSEU|nr:unnamed protein product [Cuscuta europaea]
MRMESIRPSTTPAPNSRTLLARTFRKLVHLKTSSSSSKNAFCLLIPQEKFKCCELLGTEECRESSRNKAVLEALVAKLFATISSLKAAYAELQLSQFPNYNHDAVQAADQAVVGELKLLSDLKHGYLNNLQAGSSPPHVTLMLSEIQEQQCVMKTYEITMKKMQGEIERKEGLVSSIRKDLHRISAGNKSLDRMLSVSGSSSILDAVKFSDSVSPKDFVTVLHYAMRSVRNFVKHLIRDMERASWDIDAAAAAIHSGVSFGNKSHRAFAFESFICREMFDGFDVPCFSAGAGQRQQGEFFFDQFKKLKQDNHYPPSYSPFGKFLKTKYLRLVHPKMEFSFSGNLAQRKMVNAGEFPDTDFFKAFAEMGRRIWLLHCLAFSCGHEQQVSIFQVRRRARFSEVYMESVTGGEICSGVAAFTVVPGFHVGRTVVQSQVYLCPLRPPRAARYV